MGNSQEPIETFSERMDRLSREAKEEIVKMTPEKRAEFMEAARSHAEKVRDQITASYEADIRAGRVAPIENLTPDETQSSKESPEKEQTDKSD